MNKIKLVIVGIGLVLGCLFSASSALATPFTEIEANDSFYTAQLLDPHNGTISLSGSRLGNNSADWYSFFVAGGDSITLSLISSSGNPILGLFSPVGSLLAFDSYYPMSENILISSYSILSPGYYRAGVSGYFDYQFIGGGSSDWTYQLDVTGLTPTESTVPEPATMVLFGLGGMAMALIRRRRKA